MFMSKLVSPTEPSGLVSAANPDNRKSLQKNAQIKMSSVFAIKINMPKH